MGDKLFPIRNYFFLGSYQSCIGEAPKIITKSEDEKNEKDVYLYRAYIALNQGFIPLKEIPASTKSSDLAAVRRYADFRCNPGSKDRILTEVKGEVASRTIQSEIAAVLAATILNEANRSEEAFRAVSRFEGLEARAAKVFTLIKMNRRKLAAVEVKKMNQIDEDATLSQLANALVTSVGAGGKVKDALYIYNEMAEKFGRTTDLEMHQAVVSVLTEDYAAAEELLESALERDNKDADVLINSLVAAQLNEKDDEVVDRFISQLKHDHPKHPWVIDYNEKEAAFDRIATSSRA
ncbi:unnamed protein product [Caenorhabditis sp. 36 PRJEB53466]|nr:unnamed protein product [Caenorhabditis sp. 36 PRJEB53466]